MVAQIDNTYKEYGIGKLLRRLVSYSMFEGRPHTTKGQWFNPVVRGFISTLKIIPQKNSTIKPVFIVGMGRSGTTILGLLLSVHKDVGFLNEPKAIWEIIDSRHDISGDYIADGGIYRLNEKDVSNIATRSAERIFSSYLKIIRGTRLVDKYPELVFRVDYLLKMFPDAKIVFITRNGSDAVHSVNSWSKHNGIAKKDSIEDWWGRDNIKWDYLTKQILLCDEYYKDVVSLISSETDHLTRAILEWIVTMREGMLQQEKYPRSMYKIAYEDLVANSDEELKNLFDFCELELDENVFSYAREKLYKMESKKKPNMEPMLEKIFDETMEKLGYE